MGFYGNITNVNKTQFSFDKIYSNRKAMDSALSNGNTDGIYIGRYVLVEYSKDLSEDDFIQCYMKDGKFYNDSDYKNQIQYEAPDQAKPNNNLVTENDVIKVKGETYFTFYRCVGGNAQGYAIFQELTTALDTYRRNYDIDIAFYTEGRGYDSTVWQKVYSDGKEKYVMIAELNSVVPKFAISVDPPTDVPNVPHFDVDSNDIYYQLHLQPSWGFKVGTIDYNEAGFNEYTGSVVSGDNEIYITKDKSENLYNTNENSADKTHAEDIQVLNIELPGIGNTISKVWDIVHGPHRDDPRTDEDGSLQGRLNSFKEIIGNQIPVKRASDGTIVGSKINNATPYVLPEGKDILSVDNIPNKYQGDDPWIETIIDTTGLKGGQSGDTIIDQSANSGISIRHTYHGVNSSASSLDKNTGIFDNSNENLQLEKLSIINKDNGTDDTISLYVPYVDSMGHVVGNNIETITLPYGYKTFKDSESDEYLGSSTATNTQDEFAFKGDHWIKPIVTHDLLTLSHTGPVAVNNTKVSDSTPKFGEAFTITDWYFDEKGHKANANTHTVKIPQPSLTNGTGNVVTGLTLKAEDGAFVETKDNIGNLSLTNYTKKDDSADIDADDTLNDALSKLQTQIHDTEKVIDDLDYEDENTTKFISKITQTNGKIEVTRAAAGTLVLGDEYAIATKEEDLSASDSLNDAFGKLEYRLEQEVNRAGAAEQTITDNLDKIVDGTTPVAKATDADQLGGVAAANYALKTDAQGYANAAERNAKDYADDIKEALLGEDIKDTFDTLVEIQNWIEGDGVNATELTNAIAAEAKTRDEEDTKLQNQINALDITDGKVSNAATADVAAKASGLNDAGVAAVKAVKVDNADHADSATNADQLGGEVAANYALKTDAQSYAKTAESNAKGYADGLASNYATAAQGQTAESALQLTTYWTYRENEEDEEVLYTIESLLKEIVYLRKQLDELTIKVNEAHPSESEEENPPSTGDDIPTT